MHPKPASLGEPSRLVSFFYLVGVLAVVKVVTVHRGTDACASDSLLRAFAKHRANQYPRAPSPGTRQYAPAYTAADHR